MPQSRPYLIIAQSGRALSASAAAAGVTTYVIDCFGDLDTRFSTLSNWIVTATEFGLNTNQLIDILLELKEIPLEGIVTGSGLEAYPDVLEFISCHWRLFGNTAEVVKKCKDPVRFFSLLDDLDIPHPQTNIHLKRGSGEWLLKLTGGAGGGHIRKYTNVEGIPTHYYIQEKLEGRPLSIIFLASGKDVCIVGINETWTYASDAYDYRYTGAVSLPDLDALLYASLEKAVRLLSQELQLIGLCGLDMIVDNSGQIYVVEINPRPTATFELHENYNSLFYAHIMACQGKLIALPERHKNFRAHRVIYADSDFIMPRISWPAWVVDKTQPGRKVSAEDPICTIQAQTADLNSVILLIEDRKQLLYKQLKKERRAA